jgi:hypothetical protein
MGKLNNSFTVVGNLELDMMRITEENKNGIFPYDLRKILGAYDGQKVKLSVSVEADDSDFLADEE